MNENHVHNWVYANLYRRCLTCKMLQYHSAYKIGGVENGRWINVDDIPEAVLEFHAIVECDYGVCDDTE